MNDTIIMELSCEELQLMINALEILNPDDRDAQERLHKLNCKLLAAQLERLNKLPLKQ